MTTPWSSLTPDAMIRSCQPGRRGNVQDTACMAYFRLAYPVREFLGLETEPQSASPLRMAFFLD